MSKKNFKFSNKSSSKVKMSPKFVSELTNGACKLNSKSRKNDQNTKSTTKILNKKKKSSSKVKMSPKFVSELTNRACRLNPK
jgi:hypothetical protein